MSRTGADIIKLAVMPKTLADVQLLLDATQDASVQQPLITISMGLIGQQSRVVGYRYGSEMTFATLDNQQTSAPGQLTIDELLQAWQK